MNYFLPAPLPANVWLIGQEAPARQWRHHYTPASVRAHPTKTLPALAHRLVESFTQPGDLILDPMSGIGTIGVEALLQGRRYVGLELESEYVRLQAENLEQARKSGASGEYALLTEDARELDPGYHRNHGLLRWFGPIDAILFSPPYGGRGEPPRRHPPGVCCV